jgi:putative heme transporter
VLFVAAVLLRRNDLADAWREVRRLTAVSVVQMALVAAVGIVAEGWFTRSASPEMSLRQATMVQQAATAMNNTIVGSGPLSTGLRIAMMRSWAVPDLSVGVSIVAMNVAAAFRVWLLGGATAIVGLATGRDDVVRPAVYVVVLVAAVVVLGCSAALWVVLLTSRRLAAWLARRAQRVWDIAARRLRWVPARSLHTLADDSRRSGRRLVRTRWAHMAAGGTLSQAVSVLQLVVVVRAFGIGSTELSLAEIFVSYGLIRLAAALTPIPGGLGVTEFGLTSLLTSFGGQSAAVLAAVLTYRALTFILPMFTGAAAIGLWRRSLVASHQDPEFWDQAALAQQWRGALPTGQRSALEAEEKRLDAILDGGDRG